MIIVKYFGHRADDDNIIRDGQPTLEGRFFPNLFHKDIFNRPCAVGAGMSLKIDESPWVRRGNSNFHLKLFSSPQGNVNQVIGNLAAVDLFFKALAEPWIYPGCF